MTKHARAQRSRTTRRNSRVGGSLLAVLLLPYALPVGFAAWIVGSVIAMAVLVGLILAVAALIPIAGAVAVVGAVTVPVTAVYLLTLGVLATGMILAAQRVWAWCQSVRAWMATGVAHYGEPVIRASAPTLAAQMSRTVSTH
ncbi:MAG: hypothetical protein AB7N65_08545 [Vicinamibacterales bacterium]